MMLIQIFAVSCVILEISVNAEHVLQPQLYVTDSNLHFQMPPQGYIKFGASQIRVNDIDLLSTLKGAENATRILKNYETFISQYNTKMDDLEYRLLNIGYSTNITMKPSNLSINFRRINNRIAALQKSIRRLNLLFTKDECAKNPCKNGGICLETFNGFICQCQTGWEGPTCQTDINECARFVGTDLGCQNGGTCLNIPGTYQCQCPGGWIGMHCNRKPTDCNSGGFEICGHGTCIPQNNEAGYKCLCDPGWTNDGTHLSCSVDVDECKQNHPPCSTNPLVQCVNVPGSFMCQHCPPGYTGNGYYCADINECELFNGGCSVSPYVECLNSPGSRKCGPCPAGYEGDGKICTFKGVCNINNGGCSILARCVNNPAIAETYVQCLCLAGYVGSGIGPAGCVKSPSSVITSCTPNPCVHGTCVAVRNSTEGMACVCNRQFTGTYCDQRINLCANNPCQNGGTCFSRRNRVSCSCMNGFIGRFCQNERQACGEHFLTFNGTIKYPLSDFDSSRGTENLSCAYTIKTQEDKVIEATFTKFNFADAPCTSQWLQVHDGRNSLAPALGRFCGKTLPFNGSLTTTHNTLYFWLRTNGQSNKRPAFEMSWTTRMPACGGRLSKEGIGMIVSPGWPNNYPNNRECFWRFSVPVTKRLLFHVYALNIGQNSDCTGDYLEFYAKRRPTTTYIMNEYTGMELFAKLCNSTIPESFYSMFSTGVIHFKSNEKDAYSGFQIGYSVVDGIPGCGGTYTNTDGYIQSIEVTSSMPVPLLCAYEIKLPVNSTIKLQIVEIDLEEQCDDTNIAIYLESASDTSLISKYCGSRIPGPFITYGSNILIKSQSKYLYKSHWKIRYEAVCHQSYTNPADTISANSQSKECQYLIEQPPGRVILLDLELANQDIIFRWKNGIEVWDGDNENATLIGQYHTAGQKVKIESSTNYLLIKAKSVQFAFIPMFTATYRTLDLGCGGLLRNDMGTIPYPPRGAEKYSSNKKCRWVIMAPPEKVIQLTWMTFNVEQSFDCSYDNVQVFDNNTDTGLGGLVGRYCGFTLPPVLLSSSNIMTIDFTSDSTIHGDGFLVSYTFIKERNVCGGNYFTPAGVIKSPGYPENYPTNRECVWTITVQPGSQIMLKFSNFSLESYSSCRYDWLEIRNGGTSSSPLIGKYCGTANPKAIPSHTNKLYLKFNSDMSRTAQGFKIEWSSAATGCGGTLNSPSGSIMSPHYPEPYAKSSDCLWKITVSAGSKIQIIFADIELEKHSICELDYVQLLDGPTINSKSLGKFCSQQTNPVISTQNTMLVRFRSDISFQGRGFNLQYSTICTNTMKGFRGVIESPNFPNDYPQDQDCIWDINVFEGNKINISFSHFALERSTTLENKSCAFDYVEIEYATSNYYDTDLEWRKYDRYCGDRNPGVITLDANNAKIHFVSDSLLLGTGFRLEWQLFGCGGILTEPTGTIESLNYPKQYPPSIECNWLIIAPLGHSISMKFNEIDIERDSYCTSDFIQIFNGKNDTYQEIAKFCHQVKPVSVSSTGNNIFVKFKADHSYEGHGFSATYETNPTTCGGLLTAPSGHIFSPNYPKNFNKNETCEWLIDIDEHHVIELKFEDVDLLKSANCERNYIKIYDGPTQAYPLLETICGTNTTLNKTIRSTFEHMFIEFRSDYYLTSKGFMAGYRKACGAKIKTSGSGMIQLSREFAFTDPNRDNYDLPVTCTYTIEAEDKSKHVTLTISNLDMDAWCDEQSPGLKIYNGLFSDSPLIGHYCSAKIPAPITSDGSALHIEVHRQIDLFATYSVLDNHCGGNLMSQEAYLATPGWPKSYPTNAQCSWSIIIGPGNTLYMSFIEFDIPESENCNTDFLEIRETNATGKLIGVFCGKNSPTNVTLIGPVYLMFKSSRLEEGVAATNKGFYAEYATSTENKLSGSEGLIGNIYYPNRNPYSLYGTYKWLITTNISTIIELTPIDLFFDSNTQDQCYVNTLNVFDGMDFEAPLLRQLCRASSLGSILSTSNMMFITVDFYSSRVSSKFLLKWKELPLKSGRNPPLNTTKSDCQYAYKLEGQSNVTLTSPGYPTGYAPSLQCEWIYEIPSQYHLVIRFTDVNFGNWGSYRICTYADIVNVYTKREKKGDWELLKQFCNSSTTTEVVFGSNLMKVEFQTNKYLNGTGFQAKVFGVCGGTMTEPSGMIQFDKDHAHDSLCQWNITVRAGRTIKLSFDQFDLSPNNPNNCENYLIIRNGKFSDSPFLGRGKFCGPETPPDLESTSNHLYLKYTGASSIKGFKIKYTEVSLDCGQDFQLSADKTSVEIASPNYPNIPQAHSECIWTIRAPTAEALRVDFEERFDISQQIRCTSDYLEIRDGGTELSPLIGRYCYEIPSTKFTTGNMLRVKYFTDSNEPRNGFKANISISYCGGTLRGTGIINTKEPHTIQAGSNCTWYLKAPLDYYIIIEFPVFHVAQDSANCSAEDVGKIRIFEPSPIPNVKNDTDLGTFCGRINTTEIRSSTNQVIVNYLAKADNDEFTLNFTIKKDECGGVLVQETGTITSPSYPLVNHEDRYCFWNIQVPKGRRITMFMENLDLDPDSTLLVIFNGYREGPALIGQKDLRAQQTYETSDNGAHILFWMDRSDNRRGFKIKFTSNKPSVCVGDLNTTSGQIHEPQTSAPYRCEYIHTKILNEETLAIQIVMETNTSQLDINRICPRPSTGIQIFVPEDEMTLGKVCQNTSVRPMIFRTTFPVTTVVARRNANASLNFTISFKTYKCGGLLEDDEGTISSPNFPNTPQDSVECSWRINLPSPSSRVKLNFTSFDLGDDCDKSYVIIYNGQTALDPKVGKYCKHFKPELTVSQKNNLLVEFRYEKGGHTPSKGFSLKYEPEIHGCGGVFHTKNMTIETPHYGKDYNNNEECIWDIRAEEGNMVKLHFFDRFYIEDSENCTKDYVEMFDWKDEKWVSLGRKCGRNLPGEIISSNNQFRILFRSNDKITGSGFRASWEWHCGGVLEATENERYLMSPNYPRTFLIPSETTCTYKIMSKRPQGIVSLTFLDFNLGKGINADCTFSNFTITGTASGRALTAIKQVFCGRNVPSSQRYRQAVVITFTNNRRYLSFASGFKMTYKDETCGGNITAPTALVAPTSDVPQLTGIMRFYQAKIACVWYVTAPPDQIAVLSIHNLSMSLGIHCIAQSLEVYDGLEVKQKKRLAQLCGKIEENKPIPSTSNTMLVKLDSTAYNFKGFQGEIYFTYGPSVGCGGTINLTESKHINSPNNLPHMDCHWIIVAPQDNKVQLEFTDISISNSCNNPVRNHTFYCTCSYVEVRDGGGPFADQMVKLCSSDTNSKRTFTSSWNTAYIRLYSAVPQTDMFRITLTPVLSKCGPSQLTATKQFQELTSPDYPNSYPENLKCTWIIKSPSYTGRFIIHFEELDFVGNPSRCDSDRLELAEDPNRLIINEGFGPNAKHQLQNAHGFSREALKYAFCGNNTKPFDYYSAGNEVTLTFHSNQYTSKKGRGFKLKYGSSGCNRTLYANEGRIQSDVNNSNESNCVITITAAPNRTISIYFMTFYFINPDITCSKLGLEIRENNSTGPEIFKACGFRIPNPIFSNSNQLYIRTYNLQGRLPSYFRYNFLYVSSEDGKGCGGKLFNYMGKFSSPMYPNPYREDIECMWDIMVPKGYKVALKFTEFNIGGGCIKNKLVVTTYIQSEEEGIDHSFCPENSPAVLFSDNTLRVTYYSSVNNGGTGWLAAFQAIKDESDPLVWF